VKSGYASTTGGTPLEVAPPEDGLPITLSGNQIARYSFVQLAGDVGQLHMKLAGTATDNPGADQATIAVIKICRLETASWAATRAQAMASAPKYTTGECINGARQADASYTFDLGAFPNVTTGPGWALVPSTNTPAAFQVILSPITLPPVPG
jgi:hypothetical protein